MKKTITIILSSVIILAILTASASASNPSNIVGVFDGKDITKNEIAQIKMNFSTVKANNGNMELLSDTELLQAYSQHQIMEQMFVDNQIALTVEETNNARETMRETMELINKAAASTDEAEAASAKDTLKIFVDLANSKNLSLEQYFEQDLIPNYEYMIKKAKLIEVKFNSSEQELNEHLQNELIRRLDLN